MTSDRTAYVLLSVMAVAFAGTWVAAPWATDDVTPLTVAFVRFLVASLCLLAFTGEPDPTPILRADLPIAFAMGATAVVGYNILFLYGVTLAPSTDGAIITPGLVPIVTAVLVRIAYGERLARRGMIGLGLGLVGLVLVVGPAIGGSPERLLGDLMFIGGALMWGLYTLISRRATLRLHPAHATLLATLTGTLMLAPLAVAERGWEPLVDASARSLLSIAYLGVIGTAVAFATFSEGVRRIGRPGPPRSSCWSRSSASPCPRGCSPTRSRRSGSAAPSSSSPGYGSSRRPRGGPAATSVRPPDPTPT